MSSDLVTMEHPDLVGTEIGGVRKTDAYGTEFVKAYAVQACVVNTPYALGIGAYGFQAVTPAAAGTDNQIVIADEAIATGAYGWLATRGVHELLVAGDAKGTAGDAIKVHTDGTVVSTDAAKSVTGIDEFAVLLEAHATGTSVTSLVYLSDEVVTWT